jgi:DNA-binding IclR family transcriptional regulator
MGIVVVFHCLKNSISFIFHMDVILFMQMYEDTMRSCSRTLRILEVLASAKEMGVTDIAGAVGFHKSTVYRFLDTLVKEGYVIQNPETEKYRLSFKVLRLGYNLLSNMDLRNIARPFMEHLAHVTKETVYLTTMDDGMVLYLDKVNLTENLQTFHKVGDRNFVHCTATGKVQAAFLPEDKVDAIINRWGMPRCAKNTITDPDDFKKHLNEIRQCGYAVDDIEAEDDVRCVAAPIRDYTGNVAAGLSISGPATRMTLEKIKKELVPIVVETADDISRKLGYEK